MDAAGVRVGVARFESVGPPGAEIPDVATLLADRIGTLGVGKIVGPAALGAPADADASAAEIQQSALRAGVDLVVIGRTTQIGTQLSIDLRLMSGTGTPRGSYVREVSSQAAIPSAIDSLADQILRDASALSPPTAPVAQAPPKRSGSAGSPGFKMFDSSAPISIQSDSLSASDVDGRRRLEFEGNVRVTQRDVKMTSRRLTADYPQGGSEPSRMVATGSVRVVQGKQEARCDKGTYKRSEDMLVCCGNAQLLDGQNRVRGSCIEFDLSKETVHVKDATVNIIPENEETAASGSGGTGE